MIIYFCDRQFNILGQATTDLPSGYRVSNDNTVEEVESGVNTFECDITWTDDTRTDLQSAISVGNYILKSGSNDDNYNSFFQIVDTEADTKDQSIRLYAEDAGLDLLNTLCHAVVLENKTMMQMLAYFLPSDWSINIQDAPTTTKTNEWQGESTCTERIRSVVGLWDCELYYSFRIEGLQVKEKIINVVKKRGLQEAIPQLRLNYDIDRIVTKTSITDLLTALAVTGGTPEDSDVPVTLVNYDYSYEDPTTGDIYQVDKTTGQMRNISAMDRWSSVIDEDGLLVGSFSFDTTDKAVLAGQARAELQKRSVPAVNYEVDFANLPEDVQLGDRVNVIDDAGELYLEARILKIETSEANGIHKATLGEYLLRTSGISDRVAQLASDLASQRATDVAIQNQMQVITDTVDAMFTLEVESNVVLEQATLTARLLKGNKDVKTDYDPNWFKWILRSEKGERLLGRGYTLTVDMGIIGYASTILCRFIRPQLYDLTDHNLVAITDQNLDAIQVSFAGIYNQPVVTRRSLKSKKNALRSIPTVEVGDPTVSREVNLYERGTVNETVQRFWVTEEGEDAGAHITEVTKEEFEADPQGGNLLARSNGIAIRDGLTELASFGADATQIGASGATHGVFSSNFINFVTENDDPILVAGKLPNNQYGLYLGTDSPSHTGVTLNTFPDDGSSRCNLTARSEPNTQYGNNDASLSLEAYLLPSGEKYHYLTISASATGWNGIQASTNITVNSDERLKKDFEGAEKVSDLIMHIKPIVYSWKDERTNQRHLGFKAQDVRQALRAVADDADDYALVSEGKDGYLNLSYSELIPLLVAQIQKQNKRIEELERKVNDANT
jgi:phage minor structural protein